MSVQYQERHCTMFVVAPQYHSQNDVHVSLDTQNFLHRPPLTSFCGMKPSSILDRGYLKATGAYLRKILYKALSRGVPHAPALVMGRRGSRAISGPYLSHAVSCKPLQSPA